MPSAKDVLLNAKRPIFIYYKSDKSTMPMCLALQKGENRVGSALWAELLKKESVQRYVDCRLVNQLSAPGAYIDDDEVVAPAQIAAEEFARTGNAEAAVSAGKAAKRQ